MAVTNAGFVYSEAKLRGAEESKKGYSAWEVCPFPPHLFHKVTALRALGKCPIRKTNLHHDRDKD